MINKKYLKLVRSRKRFDQNNFIYEIIAKRVIDSLDLLNIQFGRALEIGINENIIYNYLINKFDQINIERADILFNNKNLKKINNYLNIDLDDMLFSINNYDLIYSNTILHLTNNFEKNLISILNSLKSNGFFIAVIPDKNNGYQLINSMYETDMHLYKGVFQRVNQTVEVDNILPILKKLNFDAPSIHSDNFSINYSIFKNLLKDVRNTKLSYCHFGKKSNFENKKYFEKLESIYKKKYFDNNFELDIKVNIISGWKK